MSIFLFVIAENMLAPKFKASSVKPGKSRVTNLFLCLGVDNVLLYNNNEHWEREYLFSYTNDYLF